MHAIVKTGPSAGFAHRTDVADAELGPGDVRIAVAAASICGTDRELVNYTPAAQAFGLNFPVVLGHEVSGVVIETGPTVSRVRTGDHVALESHIACGRCYQCSVGAAHNCLDMQLLGLHVSGGFAERTVVPETACFRLPEDVALETGALFESAGVAVHALQRSGHTLAGESVLIAGGGPIGLVVAQLGQVQGARDVVVVEPNPFRRALAEKLGATALSPTDDVAAHCHSRGADRGGFDLAFDCSGIPSAFDTLLRSLRREATVMCVGLSQTPFEIDTTRWAIKQGLTIKGSFGRALWSSWQLLASLVSAQRLDLDVLVTHRMPLASFGEALDLLDGDAGKVLLLPEVHPN